MNYYYMVFVVGLFISLITQGSQNSRDYSFETIHSLTFNDIKVEEVGATFKGDSWLENKIASQPINLNTIYQDKAFTKKLSNKSHVNRYKRGYATIIEEKVCPESPYIDKPLKARMTSRYGRRVHPVSGRRHVHAGIDFRGDTGTPVYSSSPGIVKRVSRKGAYGKTIEIDHGNSFTTLYGHLSGYAVKKGQWVNLGQTIGYVGRTGRVTGPHLHFEVRCYNVPLNPRKYLGKMGVVAEVRFRRKIRSFRRHHARARRRSPAMVKHDANYYTRMINLRKLHNMKKKKKF